MRVDLGFVSAYIVVRGSEAAVVDTGVSGSESAIEAALATTDLGWDAVGHVILTHHHPDHVGSMPAVLSRRPGNDGYIGEADLDNVFGPRELVALGKATPYSALTVIGTPGHTAGHISLLDPRRLGPDRRRRPQRRRRGVAGTQPTVQRGPRPGTRNGGKMAGFEYDAIYFGHGEPVLRRVGWLRDLAESL